MRVDETGVDELGINRLGLLNILHMYSKHQISMTHIT